MQEYIDHHYTERPDQGLGNAVLASPGDDAPDTGRIECSERIGRLLKSCRLVAALLGEETSSEILDG